MIRVKVAQVVSLPGNNAPVVLLADEGEENFLPIWIDLSQAYLIAWTLNNKPPPRPATHDLIKSMLDELRVKIEQVLINDLKEQTFFARITLRVDDQIVDIDSRPSDAINLALRAGAPIFVEDHVMNEAGQPLSKAQVQEESPPVVEPAPRQSASQDHLSQLRARLQEAVDNERYEEAAKLRDEIKKLTQKKNS